MRAMTIRPAASALGTERVDGLDTLRSLAIVLVFAYHYMVFVSGSPTFGWFSEIGWVGVDLFFVLSGYLIANQVFGGMVQGRKLSIKGFYARRFMRTLPNFYVVLALYFLFPVAMGGNPPPPLWRFVTFTQNILLQPGTAFSHAWSLCIEEQFYLLLPAAALLAARTGRSVRMGWCLVIALMAAAVMLRSVLWAQYGRLADGASGAYHTHIYYATWCRFDEFLPGVALAMLKNFHPARWERVLRWGSLTLFGGVASVAAVSWLLLNFYQIDGYGYGHAMTAFGYSMLACSFALLTLAALSPASPLHRVRIPGAASVAAWSYAIYLTHKPLAGIVQRGLGAQGMAADSPITVIASILVCGFGGWLLYRVVETPFMNLRDRLFPSSFQTSPDTRSPGPGLSLHRSTP
jgi:peptidoglycan/LPS O-acetylase OafA/YrhL